MSKAGRPKKGSGGLPDWFDIEKYRPVKGFKAINWFQQLAFRRSLFDCMRHPDRNKNESIKDGLCEALALLKADPIITRDRILEAPLKSRPVFGEIQETLDTALGFALMNMASSPAGVRDANYNDLAWLGSSLPDDMRAALIEHVSLFLDGFENMPVRSRKTRINLADAANFLRTLFGETKMPIASIDLSLPDETLIAEFRDYLKEWRRRLGNVSSPFLKKADFNGWYNSGVLPYLDLLLWETVSGEAMRWPAFTGALNKIADKPIGSESALMKTTKSHVAKLMDRRTLCILQSQGRREKSGALKESRKLAVR